MIAAHARFPVSGIIPARAGFTTTAVSSPPWRGDHPRSRGVYTDTKVRAVVGDGSSPLARGLHYRAFTAAMHARIIPARAGFTTRPARRSCGRWDHPRSRGVYRESNAFSAKTAGSSPLARGLLRRRSRRRGPDRIIPARAGFTACGRRAGLGGRDHPRSRGVYTYDGDPQMTAHGSSPLARGLRLVRWARGVPRRIIPARAGFTGRRDGAGRRGRDHPRSRGVYCGPGCGRARARGSSPLARGLRNGTPTKPRVRRIIPARAGFTALVVHRPGDRRDHPRSRGVYWARAWVEGRLAGSSPLARGLRTIVPVKVGGRGIIPARAGFTGRPALARGAVRDHPRSRGVYRPAGTNSSRRSGSSPLARGLLRVSISSSGDPADHPRSRGVYTTASVHLRVYAGSSPLARGLQRGEISFVTGSRIIPARAGFTQLGYLDASLMRDHPRSRGVYRPRPSSPRRGSGSSPLARGLPVLGELVGPEAWIIPARAGFTHLAARGHDSRRDHPRSRGVYARRITASCHAYGSSPLARGLRPHPTGLRNK